MCKSSSIPAHTRCIHWSRLWPPIEAPDADISKIEFQLDSSTDETLVDAAYRALRDAIVDGRLAGGQRLPQIPIAEQMGISRTPVRDALQRLTQEGLVRTVSFRRFEVTGFSAREVIDIYQVRSVLEPFTVRASLPHYSRVTLAVLEDICDQTESASDDDVGLLYRLNADFHRSLIEPCPNRIAVRVLTQLWQEPASLRLFHTQASLGAALKRSSTEHRLIVGAIRDGDQELVVNHVTEHILAAERETLEALDGTI